MGLCSSCPQPNTCTLRCWLWPPLPRHTARSDSSLISSSTSSLSGSMRSWYDTHTSSDAGDSSMRGDSAPKSLKYERSWALSPVTVFRDLPVSSQCGASSSLLWNLKQNIESQQNIYYPLSISEHKHGSDIRSLSRPQPPPASEAVDIIWSISIWRSLLCKQVYIHNITWCLQSFSCRERSSSSDPSSK